MDSPHKKRVHDILNRIHSRELKEISKLQGKGKRNKKPEKEVEKACMKWLKDQGFSVQVYESKATQVNGRWVNQAMKAGNSDCMGSTPSGLFAAIEFKAPGKLKTYNRPKNQRQRDFINEKINSGAFACVTDSVERLSTIYSQWEILLDTNKDEAKNYLISMLP